MRHSRHTRTKLGTYTLQPDKGLSVLRPDIETCQEEYQYVMCSLTWPEHMGGEVCVVIVYGVNDMQETDIEDEVVDLLNDAPGG